MDSKEFGIAEVMGLYTGFTLGSFFDIHALANYLVNDTIARKSFARDELNKLLRQKMIEQPQLSWLKEIDIPDFHKGGVSQTIIDERVSQYVKEMGEKYGKMQVIKQVKFSKKEMKQAFSEDIYNTSKLKMYILVKDNVLVGKAIVSVAHASLGAYLKWKDDADMKRWVEGVFYKVVCKVTKAEFEEAKGLADNVIITEASLGGKEVALAFKPREEWPEQFSQYKLYR